MVYPAKRFFLAGVVVALLILGLGPGPGTAGVPEDMQAGLPLGQVVKNGLAAGTPLETILTQALNNGADYCPLLKAALAAGADPAQVVKFFHTRCTEDPRLKQVCTICNLLKCLVDAGTDMVAAADLLMAAGANLEEIRACLGGMGFAGASTYTYEAPPGVVAITPAPPSSPGGGGGGVPPGNPSSPNQ